MIANEIMDYAIGVNPGRVGGVATPRFWAEGFLEGHRGKGVVRWSWTGRETLLYLIMYRKYIRQG